MQAVAPSLRLFKSFFLQILRILVWAVTFLSRTLKEMKYSSSGNLQKRQTIWDFTSFYIPIKHSSRKFFLVKYCCPWALTQRRLRKHQPFFSLTETSAQTPTTCLSNDYAHYGCSFCMYVLLRQSPSAQILRRSDINVNSS